MTRKDVRYYLDRDAKWGMRAKRAPSSFQSSLQRVYGQVEEVTEDEFLDAMRAWGEDGEFVDKGLFTAE